MTKLFVRSWTRRAFLLGVAAIPAIVAGCSGGGGSNSSGTGAVRVSLADAIEPGVTSLDVTISRIDVHVVNKDDANDPNDANWQTVVTGPITVDLLDLVKNEQLLGPAVNLPAGKYTQVRLIVQQATITDANGTYNLAVPSGTKTGIKVHGGFEVKPNTVSEILMDFSVKGSLVKQGNGRYRLKPVPDIKAVVKTLSGTITGTVNSAAGAPVDGATITATYTGGTNYTLGTVVNTTGTLADGTFKVWALLPGTYTITATDAAGKTLSKTGIVVTAENNTDAGTFQLP